MGCDMRKSLEFHLRPNKTWLWIAVLLIQGAPCREAAAQNCQPSSKPMARLELFFGAGSPRKPVSGPAFAQFLAKEVTPRFPQGLSVFDGYGQWRSPSGKITKENSKLLLIYYVPDAGSEAQIEAIREAYKIRFHQQSVLRADSFSCVSF